MDYDLFRTAIGTAHDWEKYGGTRALVFHHFSNIFCLIRLGVNYSDKVWCQVGGRSKDKRGSNSPSKLLDTHIRSE